MCSHYSCLPSINHVDLLENMIILTSRNLFVCLPSLIGCHCYLEPLQAPPSGSLTRFLGRAQTDSNFTFLDKVTNSGADPEGVV